MNGSSLSLGLAAGLALLGLARPGGSRGTTSAKSNLTRAGRIARAVAAVRRMEGWFWAAGRQDEWDEKDFSSKDYRRLCRDAGLPILGAGGSRVVFDLGQDRVLKVAWPENEGCNTVEAEAWHEAPRAIRSFLVPIYGFNPDGSWLIMAFARPSSRANDGLAQDEQDRALSEKANSLKVFLRGLDDSGRPANWGWHKGKLKLLDYAGAECINKG